MTVNDHFLGHTNRTVIASKRMAIGSLWVGRMMNYYDQKATYVLWLTNATSPHFYWSIRLLGRSTSQLRGAVIRLAD